MRLLRFMGMHQQADELAANLSYGDQRRLEIARAMATEPALLCLDEPAAGFNPAEKQELMGLIRKVRDQGFTVLLIEHDMRLVMGVTDRIVVLEFGKKIAEGSPEEIRNDPGGDRGLPGHRGRRGEIDQVAGAEAVDRGTRSRRKVAPMLLEVEGLCVNYGHIEATPRHHLQRRGGPRRHPDRRQRRRARRRRSRRSPACGRFGPARSSSRAETSPTWPPYDRVKLGISQAPEGRGIFPGMTVRENLEMGAYLRKDRRSKAYADDLARVFSLFPRLEERSSQSAGKMSGGEQQMLSIGRALMARPKLILLDEPSMGLAPMMIQRIFSIIRDINDQGTTVLLVEQNAAQALKAARNAHILETGEIVRSGTGPELSGDPAVRAAYLGGDV